MSERIAIDGGVPVRSEMLTYGKQWVSEDDIEVVAKVLRGDFLTNGPTTKIFEKAISEFCRAKYTVAFSSGTAALHAACHSLALRPGDEVLVPAITFVATANSVAYCGGVPRIVDIDPTTRTISVEDLKLKLSDKTKAIISVDFQGHPVAYREIAALAKSRGIRFFSDAAHSFGSIYENSRVGAIDGVDLTAFSFHAIKTITTGEGGALVLSDPNLAEHLEEFRSHGITKKPENIKDYPGEWFYEMNFLGFNYRITDFQCALGINQIARADFFIERRRQIVERYNNVFSEMKEVRIPFEARNVKMAYHLYILELNLDRFRVDRATIFRALRAENIGVMVHYIPVHFHPFYRETFAYRRGMFPNAERFYDCCLTLPLSASMSNQDVSDVINGVCKVFKNYLK